MNLPIESAKDIYGRDFNFMRLGLVKGRNCLSANGFKQCENPFYYEKDGVYWNWNGLSKKWFSDNNQVKVLDRVLIA